MKLILAASPEVRGGVIREHILKEIEKLTGKKREDIKVAIIPDASASDEASHHWQIESLKSISDTFKKHVWILNLFALNKKQMEWQINNADVIWCCGGSTDFLKLTLEKSGFDKILPKILQKKVWVGSSAGSVVLGRRGTTKTQKALNKGDMFYKVDEYLGVVDVRIYPHLWKEQIDDEKFKIVVEESKKQTCPVYALSHDAAVIVNGNKTYMIGTNSQKIINGEVVEQI